MMLIYKVAVSVFIGCGTLTNWNPQVMEHMLQTLDCLSTVIMDSGEMDLKKSFVQFIKDGLNGLNGQIQKMQ